uniref:Uncharacterized protein n=1 Tax=Sphaerodactylus townsendi TaxID=933632 RepID=A0ACB8EQX1_9SAUR
MTIIPWLANGSLLFNKNTVFSFNCQHTLLFSLFISPDAGVCYKQWKSNRAAEKRTNLLLSLSLHKYSSISIIIKQKKELTQWHWFSTEILHKSLLNVNA